MQRQESSFIFAWGSKREDWWKLIDERGSRKDKPLKPQTIPRALTDLLEEDAIVCTDSGTITAGAATDTSGSRRSNFSLAQGLSPRWQTGSPMR